MRKFIEVKRGNEVPVSAKYITSYNRPPLSESTVFIPGDWIDVFDVEIEDNSQVLQQGYHKKTVTMYQYVYFENGYFTSVELFKNKEAFFATYAFSGNPRILKEIPIELDVGV